MDNSLGIKRPIASLQSDTQIVKRPRFLENGIKSIEAHTNKGDKGSATVQASDLDNREAESGRTGTAVHTQKSNDSPAVVPIKKRRIQMLEATRSPSPPPSLPQSSPQNSSALHGEICMPLLSDSSVSAVSAVSSPRSIVPISGAPIMSQGCLSPVLDMQSLVYEADAPKVIERSKEGSCSKLDPKKKPPTKIEERLDDANDVAGQLRFADRANGQVAQSMAIDQDFCQTKSDGQLIRSGSGSFIKDDRDRLHWDLNTEMAAWDDLTEQAMSKISEENCTSVTPSRSPSVESAEMNREQSEQLEDPDFNGEDPRNDSVCVSRDDTEDKRELVEEELSSVEVVPEDSGDKEQDGNEDDNGEQVEEVSEIAYDPNAVDQNFTGNAEDRETEREATPPSVHTETHTESTRLAPDDPADYPDEGKFSTWDTELSPDGRDMRDNSLCYQDHMPERDKPENQGNSSMDYGDGWNDEPELEDHVDYGDSDCKDADDPALEVDDRTPLMQDENRWKDEDGPKVTCFEREDLATAESLHSSLSDTGLHPEKQSSSNRSRTTGWDQLPEGFESVEDALRASKEEGTGRGGRDSSRSSCVVGRGSLHSTSRFGTPYLRSQNRDGFPSARGDNFYVERHSGKPMMHNRDGFRNDRRPDDNFSVRGRDSSRRPGVFGRGRARGWLDSEPLRINHWTLGRHRSDLGYRGPSSTAVVPAARAENSGFGTSRDRTVTKSGMGPGRGGLRSAVSGRVGRGGPTRGRIVDRDGGAHHSLKGGAVGEGVAGAGRGYSGSVHDRSGRGMMDLYRGGATDSRRSLSPRRSHLVDHPTMIARMPGRLESRVVRSQTPPPLHRSMGFSDFNTTRNQHTQPPSRWSNEKSDPDSYQDRDFKRPVMQARLPSQRTSPHVVHGSSLTDERDCQVLARHSPPLKSSVTTSHLRKSKDYSLDSHALKPIEEEDGRYADSFGKGGDYRRGSPQRDTGREREKGILYKRNRERDGERREFHRSSSRDGRLPIVSRHSSIREGDDDVAPRRRRPS